MGTEYLSPHKDKSGNIVAGPQMQRGRVAHLLKSVSPISVGSAFEEGSQSGVASALGVPIYGKTRAQTAALKRKRELEKAMRGR